MALDLDDRGHRVASSAEALEAHGADMRRQPVQDPACRGEDSVATFFLYSRQAAEELVGYVFAKADLAKRAARNFQRFRAQDVRLGRMLVSVTPRERETRGGRVVDLSKVV